jgi:hypothetical protein
MGGDFCCGDYVDDDRGNKQMMMISIKPLHTPLSIKLIQGKAVK